MVTVPSDYRYVDFLGGTMPTAAVTGDIMPLRANPLQLRGEDVTFLAEAAIERYLFWNGAQPFGKSAYSASHAGFVPAGNLSFVQMNALRNLYSELFSQYSATFPGNYAANDPSLPVWLSSALQATYGERTPDTPYGVAHLWTNAVAPKIVAPPNPVGQFSASSPLLASDLDDSSGFFHLAKNVFSKPLFFARPNFVNSMGTIDSGGNTGSLGPTASNNILAQISYYVSSNALQGWRLYGPSLDSVIFKIPDSIVAGISRVWLFGGFHIPYYGRHSGASTIYRNILQGCALYDITDCISVSHVGNEWQVTSSTVTNRHAIVTKLFDLVGVSDPPPVVGAGAQTFTSVPEYILVEATLSTHTKWWS